jgi:hypothetical protein
MFELFTASAAPKARRFSVGRSIAASALIGLGSLFAASSSLAANANFTVTVQPIPTGTSVGRSGLDTYAAYKVDIVNVVGNTTNAVRFSGSTAVSGDCDATSSTDCNDAGAAATYVETIPSAACSGSGTSFQCNLGQMKAGDSSSSRSFVLIFKAPALAAADRWADAAAIQFKWSLDYASGSSSGSQSSIFCNGQPCSDVASTNLITTDTTAILSGLTSYIPSLGGTFFTGNGISALSSIRDATSTTKLLIPPGQKLTTTQVQQCIDTGGQTSATTTTNRTYVTVPNGDQPFGNFATIELRRDVSTIAKGAKIANAVVSYSHSAQTNNACDEIPVTDLAPIPPCPADGVPVSNPPVPAVCEMVTLRKEFTKKDVTAGLATPDDIGDWLFVIHALENGGFKF